MKHFRQFRKIFCATVLSAAFIVPSGILTAPSDHTVYADEKDEIKEIQYKNAQRKKLKEEAQEKLNYLNVKATDIREVISQLDQEIGKYQAEIAQLTESRNAIQAEISVTESNLQIAYIAEANQYERMKERIAYAYENGDVSYIDALVSLDDFSNIINQTEYVEQVSSYDQKQLNDLMEIKRTIYDAETQLKTKLNEVLELKADTEAQQEAMEITQEGKKAKLEEYNEMIYSTNGEITSYQQLIDEGDYEIQRLEAEYRRKQEEAKREAARKKAAEEAAKKKAAEEAARKKTEEEAAEGTTTNQNNESTSTTGSTTETETGNNNKHGFDEVQETYTVTGWKWPLPARHSVASYFGYRTAPCVGASTDHKGIDIGCSVGSSVVAAAAGRIMYTSKSDARGNYIRVDHGNGFTSLYQHLSSFAGYSAGDYVEAGTVIAYSGMTGICSAPHLHFEIWKNNVPVNPLNYVSP